MAEDTFLDVKQTATLLNLSPKTLYRLCAARLINPECGKKFGKKWRFRRELVLQNKLLKR